MNMDGSKSFSFYRRSQINRLNTSAAACCKDLDLHSESFRFQQLLKLLEL